MSKIPISIVIGLVIIASGTGFYVASLQLTDSELVQAEIGIFATFGALVSATFVVYSYLQTNSAFVESQRPQLLIWVESKKLRKDHQSSEEVPATFIHYKNITLNQFSDLTISVIVTSDNRAIDLSDLFRPKMAMIGYDQRQRFFEPLKLLSERGLDINQAASRGSEVLLKVSYAYTYTGGRKTVHAQEYKWDPKLEQWIIA